MSTPTTETMDLRPDFLEVMAWAGSIVAGVRAEQLDLATPCGEWKVRDLLGHMVAVLERLRGIGAGADPFAFPNLLDGVPAAQWCGRFTEAVEAWKEVWSDDAVLVREVRAPFGAMPGGQVLGSYLFEYLVHGWDLAKATGQDSEAPAALAERALAIAPVAMPAEHRGEGVPFDPPVEPRPEAGPTERLANWLGRAAT